VRVCSQIHSLSEIRYVSYALRLASAAALDKRYTRQQFLSFLIVWDYRSRSRLQNSIGFEPLNDTLKILLTIPRFQYKLSP